eukprot:16443727-Heterocapsa_arctica.AAC.1
MASAGSAGWTRTSRPTSCRRPWLTSGPRHRWQLCGPVATSPRPPSPLGCPSTWARSGRPATWLSRACRHLAWPSMQVESGKQKK